MATFYENENSKIDTSPIYISCHGTLQLTSAKTEVFTKLLTYLFFCSSATFYKYISLECCQDEQRKSMGT